MTLILECDYCDKTFTDPTEIALHVRDEHDTSHQNPTNKDRRDPDETV